MLIYKAYAGSKRCPFMHTHLSRAICHGGIMFFFKLYCVAINNVLNKNIRSSDIVR